MYFCGQISPSKFPCPLLFTPKHCAKKCCFYCCMRQREGEWSQGATRRPFSHEKGTYYAGLVAFWLFLVSYFSEELPPTVLECTIFTAVKMYLGRVHWLSMKLGKGNPHFSQDELEALILQCWCLAKRSYMHCSTVWSLHSPNKLLDHHNYYGKNLAK